MASSKPSGLVDLTGQGRDVNARLLANLNIHQHSPFTRFDSKI
jgi:hypothetical protein